MKNFRKVLALVVLMLSLSIQANDGKVISGNDENVTITEKNQLIQVSILNVQNTSYRISVYSPQGDLLYDGKLGNETSIGKTFSFKKAEIGIYVFKVTDEFGNASDYEVKTGSRS